MAAPPTDSYRDPLPYLGVWIVSLSGSPGNNECMESRLRDHLIRPHQERRSIFSTDGTPWGCTDPIDRSSARSRSPAWLRPDFSEPAGPASGAVGPAAHGHEG